MGFMSTIKIECKFGQLNDHHNLNLRPQMEEFYNWPLSLVKRVGLPVKSHCFTDSFLGMKDICTIHSPGSESNIIFFGQCITGKLP